MSMIHLKNTFDQCPEYIKDIQSRNAYRAAAMEYLFSMVNKRLQNVTEDAAQRIFAPFGGIPHDLITVHIRWSDKSKEMNLVSGAEYGKAVNNLVVNESIRDPVIYLVTESPMAYEELREALDRYNKSWRIVTTGYTVRGGTPVQMGKSSDGEMGKLSLISLLLAVEAKYYVITTGSNWSRLINELRTNVKDQWCNSCTKMIDLQHGFVHHDWRIR